jgi:hypothetical protein
MCPQQGSHIPFTYNLRKVTDKGFHLTPGLDRLTLATQKNIQIILNVDMLNQIDASETGLQLPLRG